MSVATHLTIDLGEYDARILTFIPDYRVMLDAVAHVVRLRRPRAVLDLGTGTGALAARVASEVRSAAITGVDEDAGMLAVARQRLKSRRFTAVHESFLTARFPACDAITASFALHHIERMADRRAVFARAYDALRSGGVLVSADCHPPAAAWLAADGRRAWLEHLRAAYGTRQAERFLRAWAREDFYTTIETEAQLLQSAGFTTSIVWRRNLFAVIVGEKTRRHRTTKAERPVSATGRPSRSAITDQ